MTMRLQTLFRNHTRSDAPVGIDAMALPDEGYGMAFLSTLTQLGLGLNPDLLTLSERLWEHIDALPPGTSADRATPALARP